MTAVLSGLILADRVFQEMSRLTEGRVDDTFANKRASPRPTSPASLHIVSVSGTFASRSGSLTPPTPSRTLRHHLDPKSVLAQQAETHSSHRGSKGDPCQSLGRRVIVDGDARPADESHQRS